MSRTISLPFSIDANGKIATTTDPVKQYADQLVSIIGTHITERVMMPAFGSRLADYNFEDTKYMESAIIEQEVIEAVGNWQSNVRIDSVSVIADTGNEASYTVSVWFSIPSINEQATITVKIATVTPTGVVEE